MIVFSTIKMLILANILKQPLRFDCAANFYPSLVVTCYSLILYSAIAILYYLILFCNTFYSDLTDMEKMINDRKKC